MHREHYDLYELHTGTEPEGIGLQPPPSPTSLPLSPYIPIQTSWFLIYYTLFHITAKILTNVAIEIGERLPCFFYSRDNLMKHDIKLQPALIVHSSLVNIRPIMYVPPHLLYQFYYFQTWSLMSFFFLLTFLAFLELNFMFPISVKWQWWKVFFFV